MKFLSLYYQKSGLAVLILYVTSILALESRDSILDEIDNDFDKAKNFFESEVAAEVAGDLAKKDGVLAQISMGYSEQVDPQVRI